MYLCIIILQQSHHSEAWITFLVFFKFHLKNVKSHDFWIFKKRRNVFSNYDLTHDLMLPLGQRRLTTRIQQATTGTEPHRNNPTIHNDKTGNVVVKSAWSVTVTSVTRFDEVVVDHDDRSGL